jgi:hypothetical protein
LAAYFLTAVHQPLLNELSREIFIEMVESIDELRAEDRSMSALGQDRSFVLDQRHVRFAPKAAIR